MDDREWLHHFINERCIYRVGPGEEPLPAKNKAKKYTWQFYLRRGLTNKEFLHKVGTLFWQRFASEFERQPFQITGLETGATPLVVGLAMTAPFPVNCFITRADRKTYGLLNRFEGIIDDALPVMIVDDLSSSKKTMHLCKSYLEEAGLEIYDKAFAVINKDVGSHDYGYLVPDVVTLFNASDFNLKYRDYFAAQGRRPERWSEGKRQKAIKMLDYVYGYDQIVAHFVADLIPHCRRGFGDAAKAIGVINGEGKLIAGIVYHNWDPDSAIIEISGAALPGSYWLTRETLRRMFGYPFHQCGCQMVVQRTPADDERLLYVLARYGYSFVSVPRLFGRNRDGVICTLTREAWADNKFNRRLAHHISHETEEAA